MGRVVVGLITTGVRLGDIVGTFVTSIGRMVGFRVMGVSVSTTIMGDVVGNSVVTSLEGLVGGDTIGVEVVFGVGVMIVTGLLVLIMIGGDDEGVLTLDGKEFVSLLSSPPPLPPPPQFPVPQYTPTPVAKQALNIANAMANQKDIPRFGGWDSIGTVVPSSVVVVRRNV